MHPNINFTFIAVNSKVSGNTEALISTNFVDTSRPVFAWIACCTLIDIWKYATAKDMYKYAKYQEMWYLYYVFFICIDMKRKRSGKRLLYYCGTSVYFADILLKWSETNIFILCTMIHPHREHDNWNYHWLATEVDWNPLTIDNELSQMN